MPPHVTERLAAEDRMPGVFEVPQGALIGAVIEDLLLLSQCSVENEWEGRILYLPLA